MNSAPILPMVVTCMLLLTGSLGAAQGPLGLEPFAEEPEWDFYDSGPNGAKGAADLLETRRLNQNIAEDLLTTIGAEHESDRHRSVALAKATTKWQSATLGLEWEQPVDLVGHEEPSQALLDLAHRYDIEPSPGHLEQMSILDELDEPLRTSLTRFIDAFLALDTAARLAYQDAEVSILEDFQDDHEQQGLPGNPRVHGGESIPGAILKDAGVDLSLVFPTRNQFLDAILDLQDALTAVPTGGCNAVALAPVFSISIGGCDETYNLSYALGLDTGGNDRHYNNAGGSSLSADDCSLFRGAAALVDLGGSDEYGDPTNPRECGANGGGTLGVGFLLDLEGDDTYTAGDFGTNGGSYLGVGFLLDVEGDDTYTAGSYGTNGGGWAGGVGFLLDAGGDDTYTAGETGTNGGGSAGSVGFLVDAGGDDTYTAGETGTNGGGNLGVGYLFDSAGTDYYEDPAIPEGSCWDCTILPKGEIGAQVDEVLSVPDLQAQVVPIAKLADLGITETPTATITIEQGLFRASAIGTFADLPILVPLLSGEPHPDNLNHDLGVASTSYTYQEDVCIDGQCVFGLGAGLGDDVKVGELWEAELRILVDGAELLSLPFVEVRLE